MTDVEKERLRSRIADFLIDNFEPLFDKHYKLTFVARAPHLGDGDVVVTSDDIELVVKALNRLNTYDPIGILK